MLGTSSTKPPKGKETSTIVFYTNLKKFFLGETSTYSKFNAKLFNMFKAPNHHNCCAIVLWKFLPLVISILSEWSIDKTAVSPSKTSAINKKYILNEILDLIFVALCKYMNCAVDKTTDTETGQTTYINHTNNYHNNNNNILILFINSFYKPLETDPSE